jgi:dihydroneopterin aldolase
MTVSVARRQIFLHELELEADIGFHPGEIGVPQRLRVSVEVTLDEAFVPTRDEASPEWSYDRLRDGIRALVAGRRFNLQETVAREVWALVMAMPGVQALTVTVAKPDIYPDAREVGVRLSSH